MGQDWKIGNSRRVILTHGRVLPSLRQLQALQRPVSRFLLVAVSYMVLAQVGKYLSITEHFISLVWAPTGISVAMLTIWGLRYWSAVFLGAFIAPLTFGLDPVTALWLAAGGCAAPVLGAHGLRTTSLFDSDFGRRTSVFYFILVAGFAAMLISSTNGAVALYVSGYLDADMLLPVWVTYWIGDALGVLIVAPVILTATHERWHTWRRDCSAVEFLVIAASLIVLTWFAFTNPLGFGVAPTVVYLPFPLLIWMSLRGGAFVSALSTLIVTGMALVFTVNGYGPFATGDLYHTVFSITVFSVYATTAGFVFVSLRKEREKVLDDLRRNEAFLKTTGHMAKVGGWELDLVTGQVSWTDELLRIYDLNPATATVSPDLLDFYDHPGRDRLEGAIARAKSHGEPFDLTLGMTTANGVHRWVRLMCRPQCVREQLVKLSGTVQDVTVQTEAERALRERESTYRILAENVSDIIWTADLDMKMTYISPSVQRVRGYTVAEAMALETAELGPEGTEEKVYEFTHSLLDSASSSFDDTDALEVLELALYRKDGTVFPAEVAVTVLRDENGVLSGLLGVTRDITARKQAEISLRESEQRLNRTGRIAQVGGWEYDVPSDTMYWTEETGRIFDRPPDYTPDLERSLQYCHPDDRAILRAQILGALEHGASVDLEHRAMTHKGTDRWVRSICEPVVVDGKTVRLLGTIQDITDRKRTEAHLRLLESVITHTNDAVIISDARPVSDTGPLPRFVNEGFTRMTGYRLEDIDTGGLGVLRGPNTDRSETERLTRHLEQEQPYASELIIYGIDGREIYGDVQLVPVMGEENTVTHVITVIRDITERKRAEAERLALGARSTAIVESAVDAIITFDESGLIDSANAAAELLFARQRDALVGMKISQLLCTPQPDESLDTLSCVKRLARRSQDREARGLRSDGHSFPISFSVGEFEVNAERFFTVIIHDMTRQAALEHQLLQSQKMESLGTLAGGIAHDFNNILQAIMGFSGMARQHIADRKVEMLDDCIGEIDKGAFRAASLVEQILTFSRDSVVSYRTMDLRPIVQEVLAFLRGSLPVTIQIEARLCETQCTISGDPTQLHQVISNLATNAFHAMEERGGTLRVSLERVDLQEHMETRAGALKAGDYAHIMVSDTGVGIPKDIQDHIFDPFFTTKHKGKGTGLGLATVHGIIARMGGGIQVESVVGSGCTIHIYLPLLDARFLPAERSVPARARVSQGSGSILIVDDEEPIVSLMTMVLKKKGFESMGFTNAEKALEHVRSDPLAFDLAIVDYTMPEMTGVALATALHAANPDMPILISTGMTEGQDFALPDSIGVVQVLRKPLPPSELLTVLHAVLGKRPEMRRSASG